MPIHENSVVDETVAQKILGTADLEYLVTMDNMDKIKTF